MNIRKIEEKDIPDVVKLINYNYTQFFDSQQPLDEQKLRQWINNKNSIYRMFVVEQEGEIVGYLSFTEEDKSYLAMIQVHPDCRKVGIGRYELKFAIDYLKAKGSSEITMEIRTDNLACISLVESEGFARESVRENIMADGGSTYVYSKRIKT